jgi:hypothetical protein
MRDRRFVPVHRGFPRGAKKMDTLPTNAALGYLLRQQETAWKLAAYHLDGLTTAECLWRPASVGLHVQPAADGRCLLTN